MGSGKAENLAALARHGFRVPPFVVVLGRPTTSYDVLGPHKLFAVRSSATGEDSAALSFAGIHESFLNVPRDGIAEAIEKVRASAKTERAIAYRQEHGIPLDEKPMPVIVQQMIAARTSGVVFTANPTTQDTRELVISALFGLGEGLVSHGFDADTFTVRKDDLSIRAEIVEKREAIGVSVADPNAASLTDDEVRELAKVSIEIEKAFGGPQDIEFAFDADGLWILQTRPITTIQGNRLLWDNSNIVESFSGVTSPMTFSVIRRAYAIVYRLFAQVMGIPDSVVAENKYVFENTLGLFRGQVFYNLLNWYAMVRLFPGYEQNKQFMESMMGVRESTATETTRSNRLAMIPLAWRMFRNFTSIDRLTKEFEANFKKHYDRWSRIDFDALKPHELMRLYYEFEDRVLWSWRAPIINDFFVMIFYGTLKKLTPLHNDLLSGEGGIESAEPAKMLVRIADLARPNASLRDAIERGDLAAAKQHPEFARELDRYMELYGFRGMNELKLEEPPLRDRPDVVLMFIRNYLDEAGGLKPAAPQVREEAERRAPRNLFFRYVLKRARIGVRNRENMRFARTRIFGLVREVVRAMGRRLTEEGIFDSADDVFYLGLEELWDYVKGTALTTNLRELTALRKKEFDEYRANPDIDERFETFGMAYHRNRFRSQTAPSQDGAIKGIACSPGVVTGPVKVLRSPNDDLRLNGEILVAERTDPGWVPLYPSISGLLIERGSILSHSAIVAREMGIPTIVGIRGLTQLVKSDDVVTMDGSTGVVELH
ncbi:MAG TPA: PEP/pyruvate-binding domain-containing protein [Thermoanaerobaculia bacterium]|nr:PEP/pyruvate-binding domain-containing protein [Thermoanaerobaculia bacterium]